MPRCSQKPICLPASMQWSPAASFSPEQWVGWVWAATYLHFPEASPENVQQRHGGAREAAWPSRALLGTGCPSLGTRLQGTRGSVRASPGPALHQPALHRAGEAESSRYPELSSPPLRAPPGGLAQGGRKGRREEESRLAQEEGPGGGSLIQTRHR